MNLAIISHTEHYKNSDGTIVGWGPTISEINHLAQDFDEIYHIAFLHPGPPPPSSLPYLSSKIKFIPLKPVGGKGLFEKVKILVSIPSIINTVRHVLKKVDFFQLRTPTGIGVFLIPYLTFCTNKKGWYKYAGNWNQKNPPLGYALQRWMLKKQQRKVTINGSWPNQPKHCLTFENPCLTEEDRCEGQLTLGKVNENTSLNYCFVGSLTHNKGINLILDALKTIPSDKMATFHVVGQGPLREELFIKRDDIKTPVQFYGSLPREKVFEIYKKCQFIVLPSKSEGFPKVIGEAMNFGCLPIVSNVSCIGQYVVDGNNGFLIAPRTQEGVSIALLKSFETSAYGQKIKKNYDLAEKFTFHYYRDRLKNEIFK